jgi:hypothetical protein
MSVARRRERYLSQYLSDTTNERTNEQTNERERTRKSMQTHGEREKRERERASKRKETSMQKNRIEKREIAKRSFDSLYRYKYRDTSVMLTGCCRIVTAKTHSCPIFLSFFYSFFIFRRDLDNLFAFFFLYNHFLCVDIVKK